MQGRLCIVWQVVREKGIWDPGASLLPWHILWRIRPNTQYRPTTPVCTGPDAGPISFDRRRCFRADTLGDGNQTCLITQLAFTPLENLFPVLGGEHQCALFMMQYE